MTISKPRGIDLEREKMENWKQFCDTILNRKEVIDNGKSHINGDDNQRRGSV